MLNTVVSSKMLLAMGAAEGYRVEQTLTGFKWLGARALELTARDGACVPFAYEEAIGFAIGERVRDKDGIAAALGALSLANTDPLPSVSTIICFIPAWRVWGCKTAVMYTSLLHGRAHAVFAEMAAHHRHHHAQSCCERLDALYDAYGYFAYRSSYVTADDPALMRRIFDGIRGDEGGQGYCAELAGALCCLHESCVAANPCDTPWGVQQRGASS